MMTVRCPSPSSPLPRPARPLQPCLVGFAILMASTAVFAGTSPPAGPPKDGQWRGTLAAGFSLSTGATRTRHFTLDGTARSETEASRWTLVLKGQHSRDGDVTSAERLQLGARHDRTLGPRLFGFAGADVETDRPAGLSTRLAPSAGLGWKLVQSPRWTLDALAGLSYTQDRYDPERVVGSRIIGSARYGSGLLGLESTQAVGTGLSLRQRLALRPALQGDGPDRAEFDAALSFALSGRTALNVAYTARREGASAGSPARTDTVFTTGVSVRFE